MAEIERESMEYDVVIVGAGPAGLSAAIRLKQLDPDLSVVVLEKGSEVGAHILSGAVLDPVGLDALLPDWRERGAPITTEVTEDRFYLLGHAGPGAHPELADAAADVEPRQLHRLDGQRLPLDGRAGRGARRRDLPRHGRERAGLRRATARCAAWSPASSASTRTASPGRTTSRAWSCSASTCCSPRACAARSSKQVIARYGLAERPRAAEVRPRHEGALGGPPRGAPARARSPTPWAGRSARNAGGGSFMYHLENNQVYVGFVVHLNYENPWLYPYMEFQRFKHHPLIAEVLKGGKRVAYGARAISEGGWQSVPKLTFPGGALIGCSAGFVNVPRIKGNHNAMLSGIAAAEAAHAAIAAGPARATSSTPTPQAVATGPIAADLKPVRNVKPLWSRYGLCRLAGASAASTCGSTRLTGNRSPFGTMKHGKTDAEATAPRRALRADRLSEARRRAELRPADQRRLLLHQPRRGPALPPDAEGPATSRSTSTCRATPSRRSATARPGSTRWCATRTGRTRGS